MIDQKGNEMEMKGVLKEVGEGAGGSHPMVAGMLCPDRALASCYLTLMASVAYHPRASQVQHAPAVCRSTRQLYPCPHRSTMTPGRKATSWSQWQCCSRK